MTKSKYTKRAILVELNRYHGEVLPSLVYYLNSLGYWVDILTTADLILLDPFVYSQNLDCKIEPISNSFSQFNWQHKVDQYDILVWNSIEPEKHLDLVSNVHAPTLAIIHNGSRLLSTEYKNFFNDKNRQALVLSPHLQDYIANNGLTTNWIFPSYFSDIPHSGQHKSVSFCVQGKMEFKRRNYMSMIKATKSIVRNKESKSFHVKYIGKSDSFEGFLLRSLIKLYGLTDYTRYSNQVSLYKEYLKELSVSDFLCPLIDDSKKYRSYYCEKASSSIPISIGNGIIPILHEKFAKLYHLENIAVCYSNSKLENALRDALNLTLEQVEEKRKEIFKFNNFMMDSSIKNLDKSISLIGL